MFSYTLNVNTWSMEQPTQSEDQHPKKRYTKKTREPDISLIDAFNDKYPGKWHVIMDEFRISLGNHKPTWRMLTKVNLVRFIEHLKSKYAPNTVNQYATRLKAVLNIYSDEIDLPHKWTEILSPRRIPSTAVYLNEDELRQLEKYKPKSEYELLVKNLFLCSAYSGARSVDIMRMNKSNIRGKELVFIAQKTHKESRIPLKPIVMKLIKEMPQMNLTGEGYNKIIRRICKNVGLTEPVKILKAGKEVEMPKYKAISSHTARRSFATNLYQRGVDIYTISQLLQHSDIKLTAKYICISIKSLDESAMGYFS